MGDALTIEKVFEDVGWIDKWKARGESRGRAEGAFAIAQNMVNLGLPIETVISATQLDPEKIKALYQK
jgi:predicted transposase YdaD